MGNKIVPTTWFGLIICRKSMSKLYSLIDTSYQNIPDFIHHPYIIPREIRKRYHNVQERKRKIPGSIQYSKVASTSDSLPGQNYQFIHQPMGLFQSWDFERNSSLAGSAKPSIWNVRDGRQTIFNEAHMLTFLWWSFLTPMAKGILTVTFISIKSHSYGHCHAALILVKFPSLWENQTHRLQVQIYQLCLILFLTLPGVTTPIPPSLPGLTRSEQICFISSLV